MMSDIRIAMKAMCELNKVLEENEDNLVIKKLKGLKKVNVTDVYSAQVYTEALVLGKQPPTLEGHACELLKKFNVI